MRGIFAGVESRVVRVEEGLNGSPLRGQSGFLQVIRISPGRGAGIGANEVGSY